MKAVKLSKSINYLHLEDNEGPVGVMTFTGNSNYVEQVASIEDQTEFKHYYTIFKSMEVN